MMVIGPMLTALRVYNETPKIGHGPRNLKPTIYILQGWLIILFETVNRDTWKEQVIVSIIF